MACLLHAYFPPGNIRPLSIELRKFRAGVGYRTTSVSRSPSPAPPPKKAPIKIIRPPKEPVAPTSRVKQAAVKGSSQVNSLPKAKSQKSAPPKSTPVNPPSNPPKQSTPKQPLLSPPTAVSPPPSPLVPLAPSDLYISMMSGLAMANMPQTMRVAASTDPMAAFQLARMCFVPTSPFSLPPFSLIPPRVDPAPVPLRLHAPNLPPKPVFNSTAKSSTKVNPAPPPASSPVLSEGDSNPSLLSTSTSASDPPSAKVEMDPLILKEKRQARKNNIGWIPEPGFPERGTFDLVPTISYARWSSSNDTTPPDPRCSLVMEDLPCNCRTVKFVRSWADQFPATAVYLNGNAKALIEFPSREIARVAYNSPRLRGEQFRRAAHVRVFWYRPRIEEVAQSPMVTADGSSGVIVEMEDQSLKVETTDIGKGKGTSLPPPELALPGVDLPVRSSTAPTSIPRPGSPFAVNSMERGQGEQIGQSSLVEPPADGSRGRPERTTSRPPASPPPSASPISPVQAQSPHPRLPPLETVQRDRTPTGSPPSLRYPSSTPEMTNDKDGIPPPSEETPRNDTKFSTSSSDPVAEDPSREQRLRIKLLAMRQTRIANRSSDWSSSSSTPSAVVEPDPDTLFRVASPLLTSETPNNIAASGSLELLAASFITDTIQAAQGLPSEQDRFDAVIKARLSKKRGSHDAFGSSADIAFKRQRLAQQIEESKRIMERWKAARTKEEKSQIYALWKESNRFVLLAHVDRTLILVCDFFTLLFLGLLSYFRSPQQCPFNGHAMRKAGLSSIATMRRTWTCLDR